MNPKPDEFWIARIQYWPHGKVKPIIVQICLQWPDGSIDFTPFGAIDDDIVRSTQCAQFELLEKIDLERYE